MDAQSGISKIGEGVLLPPQFFHFRSLKDADTLKCPTSLLTFQILLLKQVLQQGN
jgi:hypothetical protein